MLVVLYPILQVLLLEMSIVLDIEMVRTISEHYII